MYSVIPISGNLNFSSIPITRTKLKFPLDLFHCTECMFYTPDILNSRFLEPIFVSLGGYRNRDSQLSGHPVITDTRYYGQNPALHLAKAIEV